MELHSNFTKKPMMQAMDLFYLNLNWRYPGTSNSGHVLPGQYVLSGKLRKTPNLFVGEDLGYISTNFVFFKMQDGIFHMHLPSIKLFICSSRV